MLGGGNNSISSNQVNDILESSIALCKVTVNEIKVATDLFFNELSKIWTWVDALSYVNDITSYIKDIL